MSGKVKIGSRSRPDVVLVINSEVSFAEESIKENMVIAVI